MITDEKTKLNGLLRRFSPEAIRRRERGWTLAIEETRATQGRALISQFVLSEMASLMLFEALLLGLPGAERQCLRERVTRAIGDHVPPALFRDAFAKLVQFVNL